MFKKKCISLLSIFILTFSIIVSFIPPKVNAATNAYFDPAPKSFYGTCTASYYLDGRNMGFNVNATASDGISRELFIEVYVDETRITHTYKTYTDGVTRNVPAIALNGGSGVSFYIYCNDSSVQLTVDLEIYSS